MSYWLIGSGTWNRSAATWSNKRNNWMTPYNNKNRFVNNSAKNSHKSITTSSKTGAKLRLSTGWLRRSIVKSDRLKANSRNVKEEYRLWSEISKRKICRFNISGNKWIYSSSWRPWIWSSCKWYRTADRMSKTCYIRS